MTAMMRDDLLVDLTTIMGSYRAEQLSTELFDLFTTPTYWPALQSSHPCLLVGGRGTGKTTVLRGLSYEGQARLSGLDPKKWDLIGLYWRVDTTVVTAFRGAGIDEATWAPIFSHYLNLTFVRLLCDFVLWLQGTGVAVSVDAACLQRTCKALHMDLASDIEDLQRLADDALLDFEGYVNNVRGRRTAELSMLGRPIQTLISAFDRDPILGTKRFAFLLDEYENLEDYQQRVVNTMIKHAGDSRYTFKVGMRETGHRERRTLNEHESLSEPADYAYIDITRRLKESDFAGFAKRICDERLDKIRGRSHRVLDISSLLPPMSELEEAQRLGMDLRLAEARRRLVNDGATAEQVSLLDSLDPLMAYLAVFWNESRREPLLDTLLDVHANPRQWATRLTNYQHAMLFTIRRGVRGPRKYFAGWDAFVQLADGNIRFLLQLVNEALGRHVLEGHTLAEAVSPEDQTYAAQEVGRRVVQQLPGVSAMGAQITKLVLGLGRVFQVMASQPEGHSPEVNQFRIAWAGAEPGAMAAVEELMRSCVMHLAVVRFPGDKMASVSGETRDFDYQLHPIFAPFFGYSYRSKRRMTISATDVQGLATSESSRTIGRILKRSHRDPTMELPEQLALFRGYFDDAS